MTWTFYATVSADYVRADMPDIPTLITATSYWRKRKQWGAELPAANLPKHLTHVGVDAGGFVATFKLGDYPFDVEQYVRWLGDVKPLWAATMDYCCEDEITGGRPGIVRERQQRTTDMAWRFWREHRSVPWRWLPTIQGWTVADYIWHARQMRPLLEEMRAHYGDSFVVGIGTLCKRAKTKMIRDVVRAVAYELPGFKFHLWGIKLKAIESGLPASVVSSDSAAWHTTGSFADHKAARKASGQTKRAYEWRHSQPAYQARIDNARNRPMPLFDLEAA